MFEFRTKILNGVVWLLAASHLLVLPVSQMLHSGCRDHSHAEAVPVEPSSVWHAIEAARHWFCHSVCWQHSHSEPSAAVSKTGTHPTCCHSHAPCSAGEDHGSSDDASIPVHNSHQCAICHVIFAARLNAAVLHLPEQTDSVPFTVCELVPDTQIAAIYELPSRGPPCV